MSKQTRIEEQYQQWFEKSADAHLIIEDNRFIDCNAATVKMLGYKTKSELLQTHPSELSPPTQPDGRDSVEKADEMMATAIKQGTHRFEWDHVRASGEVFPVEVLLTALTSAKGKTQIHTVWRDITDRKQRERSLRASERRFRSYVENSPIGIFVINKRGQFLEVNPESARLSGYTAAELEAMTLFDLIPTQEQERSQKRLMKVLATGFADGEIPLINKSGDKLQLAISTVRLHDETILGFVIDITARKVSEEQLRSSEEKYRGLFENSYDAICIVDAEGRFLDVNRATERLLGYSRPELLKIKISDIVLEEDREKSAKYLKLLETQGYYEGYEGRVKTRSGAIRFVEVSSLAVVEKGQLIGSHDILRDITERKQSEKSLIQSEARYRSLFENMHDGFALHEIVVDSNNQPIDYIFREVNEAFEIQTGLKRTDILNKLVSEVLPDTMSDTENWIESYGEVALTGKQKRIESYSAALERWFSILAYSPRKGFFATVVVDITENKIAETALRESEAKFRSVVANSNAVVFIIDSKGAFTLSDGKALKALGLEPGEVVGRQVKEVYAEYPDILDAIDTAFEGKSMDRTLAVGPIIFDVNFNPITDEHGDVVGIIGIANDITERVRINELQETLKDLANELLNSLDPNRMGEVSARYIRKYFRSDAISLWYNDHEKEVSRSLYLEDTPRNTDGPLVFEREEVPFANADMEDIVGPPRAYVQNRSAEELEHTEPEIPFGDLERASASIMFVPIRWEQKKIGVISVHSYTIDAYGDDDLNHLQLFADQIGVALQRALADEELNRSLGEKEVLLREIQHRTKNNMNVILSLMNMQARENKNDELDQAFQVTRDRIFAMSLVYDQLQKGGYYSSIDLRPYIQTLVSKLYRSLIHRPDRIKLELECGDVPISLEQAVPLGISINEIVSNAMKHAFPGDTTGTINIVVDYLDAKHIKINISDNGVGGGEAALDAMKAALGLRLVSMLVEDQLHGRHTITTKEGFNHEIEFELV